MISDYTKLVMFYEQIVTKLLPVLLKIITTSITTRKQMKRYFIQDQQIIQGKHQFAFRNLPLRQRTFSEVVNMPELMNIYNVIGFV